MVYDRSSEEHAQLPSLNSPRFVHVTRKNDISSFRCLDSRRIQAPLPGTITVAHGVCMYISWATNICH